MNDFSQLAELPTWLLAGIGVLVIVQLVVEIYALIRLFRTPDRQLVFGKKWPWVLIILFVNLVGAIVFLAAGRHPAAAVDPLAVPPRGTSAPAGPFGAPSVTDRTGAAEHAADVLYGSKGGE
ncbi:MAG TPA: PLD nuclease N-terminal domain-containing protein [Coriobacteriia bacterium]|nr:PLD nuclease N-terminal domain-containing protein [Coriobacteriia bacterium]